MTSLKCLLLGIFSVLVVTTDANLILETPNQVVEDLTNPLTVTCRLSDFKSSFDQLVSIVLSKKLPLISRQNLAFISTFAGDNVTKDPDFVGTATGKLQQDGESFVAVTFSAPITEDVAGEYECEVYGMDRFGRPVGLTKSSAEVVVNSSDRAKLLKQIQDLTAELETAKKECEGDQYLKRFAVEEEKAKKDKSVLGVSQLYNGKTFYIVTKPGVEFNDGVKSCNDYNGYLAEINEESEYVNIVDFLTSSTQMPLQQSALEYLTTGATRVGQKWEPYTHTGAQIYSGHWEPKEPDNLGPPKNWMLLHRVQGGGQWNMADGSNQGTYGGYLCEVNLG